jgi:hypothetical protein
MDECPGACSGDDPKDLFTWVNATCKTINSDLTLKWRNATMEKEEAWVIQWVSELFPWSWTVRNGSQPPSLSTLGIQVSDPMNTSLPTFLSVPAVGPGTCSSSANDKLRVFAIVNLVSALFLPVLGRRTVVYRLTFGLGGKLGSRWWALMGALSACLHFCANLVNVAVIRRTPGFEHTPLIPLALLWCTRPRLSWLAVFLAAFEAEKGMYFNSAASAITSEMILQFLAAVYLGTTANYGRKKKFCLSNHLRPYPRGADALLMYARYCG